MARRSEIGSCRVAVEIEERFSFGLGHSIRHLWPAVDGRQTTRPIGTVPLGFSECRIEKVARPPARDRHRGYHESAADIEEAHRCAGTINCPPAGTGVWLTRTPLTATPAAAPVEIVPEPVMAPPPVPVRATAMPAIIKVSVGVESRRD